MTQKPDRERLVEIASGQKGYFTAAQARSCGYAWSLLSHHVASGNFTRVRRGLYRLREFPSSRHEEEMAAWLAIGSEESVVSHQSALELLDLSDVIPSSTHVTVPRRRRGYRADPGITLHTTSVFPGPEDTVTIEGIRVTVPARSIADAAEIGMGPEQVELAVAQALHRGTTTRDKILREARTRGRATAQLLQSSVDRAEP
ncbi:MAG TPA: type IV toxin-antitoxin system AbiEi family antitoxin domain-containing protein [Gemmatimonadota bacterium]|nr:type IV toxin-antitoxin system AbiEi family antitoxin domain-containing protein [Gemmatimonadota bacterium]